MKPCAKPAHIALTSVVYLLQIKIAESAAVPFVVYRGGVIEGVAIVPPRGPGRTMSRACRTSPSGACFEPETVRLRSHVAVRRWPAALQTTRMRAPETVCELGGLCLVTALV